MVPRVQSIIHHIVATLTIILVVGLVALPVVAVAWFVLVIVASVVVSRGLPNTAGTCPFNPALELGQFAPVSDQLAQLPNRMRGNPRLREATHP